jgi:hypothetical protein
MEGASIFVMYANGLGNVTISARDGNQGHVEPEQDSSLQSGVTLLAGSGIVNGMMIANVYCKHTSGLPQTPCGRGPDWRREERIGREDRC